MIDSSVFIDFENIDTKFYFLSLFVDHVGEVLVVRDILKKEMVGLSEEKCRELGFKIVTPSTEQFLEVGPRIAGLSFYDRLCLIMARDLKAVCITNDNTLRGACKENRVLTVRGFRILRYLVDKAGMETSKALKISEVMAERNRYLRGRVLSDFRKQMSSGKYRTMAGRRKRSR